MRQRNKRAVLLRSRAGGPHRARLIDQKQETLAGPKLRIGVTSTLVPVCTAVTSTVPTVLRIWRLPGKSASSSFVPRPAAMSKSVGSSPSSRSRTAPPASSAGTFCVLILQKAHRLHAARMPDAHAACIPRACQMHMPRACRVHAAAHRVHARYRHPGGLYV